MNKLPRLDYYNISQLRSEWNLDLNQLNQALQKHRARLWFYINNKKCRNNHTTIKYFEAPANTLKDEDFFRLAKSSNEQLSDEGFNITQLPDPDSILAKKGNEELLINRSNNNLYVTLPHFKSNSIEIKHDGYIELCPEFLTDTRINITNLFNGDETYIVTVRCERKDYIRFLHPAIFITLDNLYIHRDEFERLNKILNKKELKMLPHIRQANRLKRADQITALYNRICIDQPIRIILDKIQEPIQIINLAWLLAFCRKGYSSFRDINFDDIALCSMAEELRKTLIDNLQKTGRLATLNAKYYDEVDLASGVTYSKTLSYKLPPELAKSIITENEMFSKFVAKSTKKTSAKRRQHREDAISNAVLGHLLPAHLSEKNTHLDRNAINKLSLKIFKSLKAALEAGGAKSVIYNTMKKMDSSSIQGFDKDGLSFRTTYEAFRKRLNGLLDQYTNQIINTKNLQGNTVTTMIAKEVEF